MNVCSGALESNLRYFCFPSSLYVGMSEGKEIETIRDHLPMQTKQENEGSKK